MGDADYWTFTFRLDPRKNQGCKKAFNQGGEPWWWFENEDGGLMAGGPPNFEGATFMAVHNHGEMVMKEADD